MSSPSWVLGGQSGYTEEPDHVPGFIQSHGALLAFTPSGLLATHSANPGMLGALPQIGQPLGSVHLTASIRANLQAGLAGPGPADSSEVMLADGRCGDLTLHRHDGLLFAEFEPRVENGNADNFALLSQYALARIQAQPDIASLLEAGVEEISTLSGFDRVMAYRFHADGSGEVVVERLRKPLEPCLGLRYPASDFPEHTRRLFVLNPVRVLADVKYRPVPLISDINPLTGSHIDLSYSVLRSVPPGHCEYMCSMGVQGWMAIAIVAQGRLWGMFACHHYASHTVSARVRATCRLLSQTISLMVERLLAMQRTEQIARGHALRPAIAERVRRDDYVLHALTSGSPSALDVVRACGLIAGRLEQVQTLGDAPAPAQAAMVMAWLENLAAPRFATANIARDVPELAQACAGFAGFLAIRYSPERHCWLVWFRREQVQILRWAGDPGVPVAPGATSTRATARSSFAEWQQVVRDKAEPWDESAMYEAEELRRALADISAARLQEVVRAREVLLAMIGHDLRSPVQALAMVGETLRLDEARIEAVQKQIARLSGRMGRLITHVLDLSRLQAGFTLLGNREPRDLGELLSDVVNEARYAHPHTQVLASFAELGSVSIDADRMAQVLVNLISNARHHGLPGRPVRVEAERTGSELLVRVINHGHPVSEDALELLFAPFKRGSLDNAGNPRGLGMGLYIASTIIREHGGQLCVSSGDGLVTFTVALPLDPC